MIALRRDQAGMTVVEVIVALGVITAGLLALIAMMPLSTSLIGESNLKTTATFLAQQRLEQVRNAQWTAAPAVDTVGGSGSNGTAPVADRWPDEGYSTIVIATGATNASYPGYRRQVRIADCSVVVCSGIPTATVSINTLRRLTVTVFYRQMTGPGTAGAEAWVQTTTLLARRSAP
jgi:Tfp pilus assembly protein PilV